MISARDGLDGLGAVSITVTSAAVPFERSGTNTSMRPELYDDRLLDRVGHGLLAWGVTQ